MSPCQDPSCFQNPLKTAILKTNAFTSQNLFSSIVCQASWSRSDPVHELCWQGKCLECGIKKVYPSSCTAELEYSFASAQSVPASSGASPKATCDPTTHTMIWEYASINPEGDERVSTTEILTGTSGSWFFTFIIIYSCLK
jgi:hypothetical protein